MERESIKFLETSPELKSHQLHHMLPTKSKTPKTKEDILSGQVEMKITQEQLGDFNYGIKYGQMI